MVHSVTEQNPKQLLRLDRNMHVALGKRCQERQGPIITPRARWDQTKSSARDHDQQENTGTPVSQSGIVKRRRVVRYQHAS